MSEKPVVLVTRKLPDAVERRLARDHRPILNPEDRKYETDELLELAAWADANGEGPCSHRRGGHVPGVGVAGVRPLALETAAIPYGASQSTVRRSCVPDLPG